MAYLTKEVFMNMNKYEFKVYMQKYAGTIPKVRGRIVLIFLNLFHVYIADSGYDPVTHQIY